MFMLRYFLLKKKAIITSGTHLHVRCIIYYSAYTKYKRKKRLGRIEELSIFINISEQEMHFKPKIFNPYNVFSNFITRSRKLEIDVIRI